MAPDMYLVLIAGVLLRLVHPSFQIGNPHSRSRPKRIVIDDDITCDTDHPQLRYLSQQEYKEFYDSNERLPLASQGLEYMDQLQDVLDTYSHDVRIQFRNKFAVIQVSIVFADHMIRNFGVQPQTDQSELVKEIETFMREMKLLVLKIRKNDSDISKAAVIIHTKIAGEITDKQAKLSQKIAAKQTQGDTAKLSKQKDNLDDINKDLATTKTYTDIDVENYRTLCCFYTTSTQALSSVGHFSESERSETVQKVIKDLQSVRDVLPIKGKEITHEELLNNLNWNELVRPINALPN